MRTLWVSLGLLAVAAGCGSPDPTPTDPSPTERASLESELASTTQALGEATCGTIAADEVFDFQSAYIGAGVAGGGYGHPECINGYVIDVINVPAGAALTSGTLNPRWPDPFTCLLNWGYGSLWKKETSGAYTKLQEASTLGRWAGPFGLATCYATVTLTAPSAGDYRVVTSAGFLFGPLQSANVTR